MRPKLAAVLEGPLPVFSVRGNSVVVKRVDESGERISRESRDRVLIAPPRLTAKEVTGRTRLFTHEEFITHGRPIELIVNLRDVISSPVSQTGGTTPNRPKTMTEIKVLYQYWIAARLQRPTSGARETYMKSLRMTQHLVIKISRLATVSGRVTRQPRQPKMATPKSTVISWARIKLTRAISKTQRTTSRSS